MRTCLRCLSLLLVLHAAGAEKVPLHIPAGPRPVDGWPVILGNSIRYAPAIADGDGDGRFEIVAMTFDGFIYQWHVTGDVRLLLHHRSSEEKDLPIHRLEDMERQAIISALQKFGGNRTKTAEALGIGRRTSQNKLKQYRIPDREAS